ncbi:hypothetical protein [Anditalea andensis]|uniref:HPt domain-containing protein n=1 Tax=Anditalea andensis TaxID=1048983 RepID=A0A074KS51_9BACT|nr:hypothetical protein [Anditalea andensis]KEO71724.1 hypothetical protein EL17_21295 [Anditalea andensis]
MLQLTNINYQMVLEMAEGEKDFEIELLEAIVNSVIDLRNKYVEGILGQNEEMIMQARHKIKPTLSLFGLEKLSSVIEEGKIILGENNMIGPETDRHKTEFIEAVEDLIEEINQIDK